MDANTAARALAELVISTPGAVGRDLALQVLGVGGITELLPVTTNGTTRWVHPDEPLFLIRGQDIVAGAALRTWAILADVAGADTKIFDAAWEQASNMDDWGVKKIPDLAS